MRSTGCPATRRGFPRPRYPAAGAPWRRRAIAATGGARRRWGPRTRSCFHRATAQSDRCRASRCRSGFPVAWMVALRPDAEPPESPVPRPRGPRRPRRSTPDVREVLGIDPAAVVCAATSNAPSSARRTSRMSPTRCFGSFWRHRRRNTTSVGDRSRGSRLHSGSARTTAANVSVMSSPGNARLPVSISNSTAPNAQMSARRSAALPRACSGAM